MALVWAWRADDANIYARYAGYGKEGILLNSGGPTRGADATAISGYSIDCTSTTAVRSIVFLGKNFANGRTFTFGVRWKPNYSGTPAANRGIFGLEGGFGSAAGLAIQVYHASGTGNLTIYVRNETANIVNFVSVQNAWNPTSGTWYDLAVAWDGTNTANSLKFYIDGVLTASLTPSAAWPAGTTRDFFKAILLGGNATTGINAGYFEEAFIWDTVRDLTANVELQSGNGLLNGASRTSLVSDVAGQVLTSFDGLNWTSLTAAQIKTGVNQVQAGLTQSGSYDGADRWTTLTAAQVQSGVSFTANGIGYTGSLASEVWTTLTAAQIKSGVHQIQNSVTVTGSFTGETWSTLAASDIRLGTTQIQNSVTITGTLNVPSAASGTAGTVDIANLKEQIRYVLANNNTTTGYDVIDLSSNLTRRVQNVFKYNPEKIPLDGHMLPAVYVFTQRKGIAQKTIAKDQVNGKREAEVVFTVAGAVWNQTITNNLEDPADKDLEYLMENTERVLRSYANLGGYANWQFPTDVTYHNIRLDERTHLRVAYMELQVKVYY